MLFADIKSSRAVHLVTVFCYDLIWISYQFGVQVNSRNLASVKPRLLM